MKLLLVEDEALLSKNIAKGLRLLGYAVDCAYDGLEALELYGLNDYDLMILDLNLPKLDGMEVLQRIREQDADFRILILSARDTLEDKISGLDASPPPIPSCAAGACGWTRRPGESGAANRRWN